MQEQDFQREVIQRLTTIETRLNNGIVKKQDDHEKRLRFVEKSIWIGVGALAILQILSTFVLQ